MIDLILAGVILILCCLIGWLDFNNRKERSKLINALLSKNAAELRDLEFVEKNQPEQQKSTPPDIVPLDSLDDQQFDNFIKEQLNG